MDLFLSLSLLLTAASGVGSIYFLRAMFRYDDLDLPFGERLLYRQHAALVLDGEMSLRNGNIYLTNSRLLWRATKLLRGQRELEVLLGSIDRVDIGNRDWLRGLAIPVNVLAERTSLAFYAGINTLSRSNADELARSIRAAVAGLPPDAVTPTGGLSTNLSVVRPRIHAALFLALGLFPVIVVGIPMFWIGVKPVLLLSALANVAVQAWAYSRVRRRIAG